MLTSFTASNKKKRDPGAEKNIGIFGGKYAAKRYPVYIVFDMLQREVGVEYWMVEMCEFHSENLNWLHLKNI